MQWFFITLPSHMQGWVTFLAVYPVACVASLCAIFRNWQLIRYRIPKTPGWAWGLGFVFGLFLSCYGELSRHLLAFIFCIPHCMQCWSRVKVTFVMLIEIGVHQITLNPGYIWVLLWSFTAKRLFWVVQNITEVLAAQAIYPSDNRISYPCK